MKKSTMEALLVYLANEDNANIVEIRNEIEAELNKGAEKAAKNRAMYDAAKVVVVSGLTDTPVTVAELFESIKDSLPEGFTRSKVQYGITNYWADEVVKHEGRPATYTRKV